MKSIFGILLLSLSFGASSRPAHRAGPAFAIYPSPSRYDDARDADVENIALAPEPCITDLDITGYIWEQHEMLLTREGAARFHRFAVTKPEGNVFVVVADGVRCYKGAFWSPIWSSLPRSPRIDTWTPGREDTATKQILPGYLPKLAKGKDPRNDPRIHAALKRAGKLDKFDTSR